MAKKRSESRKHTAIVRMDAKTHGRADIAAKLMGLSLADYVSNVVGTQAEKDIAREAKKLVGGEGKA